MMGIIVSASGLFLVRKDAAVPPEWLVDISWHKHSGMVIGGPAAEHAHVEVNGMRDDMVQHLSSPHYSSGPDQHALLAPDAPAHVLRVLLSTAASSSPVEKLVREEASPLAQRQSAPS